MATLRILFCTAVASFALTALAQAGLIIHIDDVAVQPGFSEAIVDVWIRADSGSVQLSAFDFEFRITEFPDTFTELRFLNPQGDLQLTDPAYVFAGGSVKRDGFVMPPFMSLPPAAVGAASTSMYTNDTFIGGDISTDPTLFGNVTVTTSPLLLARLQIVPGPGLLAPEPGDRFSIDLTHGTNTSFGGISYSSRSGTVSMVPEPSSMTLMAGLAAIGLGASWRRRKKHLRREP